MLSIFGFAENVVYDTIGIYCENFKTNFNIKIEDEYGEIIKYPIFSAITTIEDSKLHAIGVIINDIDDGLFYAVLFKLNNFFTYGIKLNITFNDVDPIFLVSKINGSWSKLNMYDKIIACAGLEKINDAGIIWKPEDIGQYYNTLIELVEM